MKFPRFRDLPLALKIGFAPGFALLMLAALAAGALWSQQGSAVVLGSVVSDASLQSSLADDSKRITAANGALYELMTAQAAGGSATASQTAINAVLAQLDSVKSSLQTLSASVPAAQQAGFAGVLSDLANYRGGVNVVGSMLGIDFNSAASFMQPFKANYARMTATLDATSTAISAASAARAAASTARAQLMGELMIGFAAATLLIVAVVSWIIVAAIRGSVAEISVATESLAGGQHDVDLEKLERRDEFGAIVRSLTVFRGNQRRLVEMQTAQEEQRRIHDEELFRSVTETEAREAQQALVVQSIGTGLAALARGDLVFRLNTAFSAAYDKLRSDFNDAVEKLQETIHAIGANAQAVRAGSAEITRASDDLARRTEQQAANLEETAAALDEITATVRKTAEGATEARDVVMAAKADAARSSGVVSETVAAMSGIENASKQIGNIIGVIDEIAFQTNLLALNAGVEAARAGDAGRGFAVVATEVRALAQRSAAASKEIKTLISSSGAQVKNGVTLVGETGKALGRTLEQVEQINRLVGEIAASAKEQATGLAEVNTAVNQMDQVTQQNAAMVEQATAASHSLTQDAEELARLVGQFQTGQAAPSHAVQKPAPKPPATKPRIPTHAPIGKFSASPAMTEAPAKADNWDEF